MGGRSVPSIDDLSAIALPVLRQRVLLNCQAEADGVTPDHVVQQLVDAVPAS
jgi:MoxR-like ATPase